MARLVESHSTSTGGGTVHRAGQTCREWTLPSRRMDDRGAPRNPLTAIARVAEPEDLSALRRGGIAGAAVSAALLLYHFAPAILAGLFN